MGVERSQSWTWVAAEVLESSESDFAAAGQGERALLEGGIDGEDREVELIGGFWGEWVPVEVVELAIDGGELADETALDFGSRPQSGVIEFEETVRSGLIFGAEDEEFGVGAVLEDVHAGARLAFRGARAARAAAGNIYRHECESVDAHLIWDTVAGGVEGEWTEDQCLPNKAKLMAPFKIAADHGDFYKGQKFGDLKDGLCEFRTDQIRRSIALAKKERGVILITPGFVKKKNKTLKQEIERAWRILKGDQSQSGLAIVKKAERWRRSTRFRWRTLSSGKLDKFRDWVIQLLSSKANMTVRTLAEVASALIAEVKLRA